MSEQQAIKSIVERLADRSFERSEATIQADIRQLLLTAPFDIEEDFLDAPLEVPVGDGRRIDIEIGLSVIEVKKDLRRESLRKEAVSQLAGYVATRSNDLGQRYTGILTDGILWSGFHLSENAQLIEVSSVRLESKPDSIDQFVFWLEGFLATAKNITPSPTNIKSRLGEKSSAHSLDRSSIADLYSRHKELPTVALKRELWAKLLTTALGTQFPDTDELFVEHTLLVLSAEIVAHAVVGFDLSSQNPTSMVTGALFSQAQIYGVVEADFFDWIIEVPGGDRFVRSLARRLSRFNWSDAQHDVMKVLYESVISPEQRKALGEYYTPDWLAEQVVSTAIDSPLDQSVLDPACGSGTFLFHAIRCHLRAAKEAGIGDAQQTSSVVEHIFGIDIHPVAVTLARVTYLLALGTERLRRPDRPAITIPVFLGDSMQWGASEDIFGHDMLTIPTSSGMTLIPEELKFPDRLLDDAGVFDRLVAEMSERVHQRSAGSAVPSLAATFRRYGISSEDKSILSETFSLMCSLHDQGRDHIWGYYVRNVARPRWLSRSGNRVDVLVGNPPWLSYRFMPEEVQNAFKEMSKARGLWHGASVATNQDLSSLFVCRVAQLYLRSAGRFGFVLPEAALTRAQFKGFRTGSYPSPREPVGLAFERPWSLNAVKPAFFPVPACAIFGTRNENAPTGLTMPPDRWAGRLPSSGSNWSEAEDHISVEPGTETNTNDAQLSPYHPRFNQGASLVPRMLFSVHVSNTNPLGSGAGWVAVESARSNQEKKPWKELPDLEGSVESQFIREMLLGESIAPFLVRNSQTVVVPLENNTLLSADDERLDHFPGMAKWWRSAEEVWSENRASARLSLSEQANYRNKLTDQISTASTRVVYGASGTYLSAARIDDSAILIDTKLYWCATNTSNEAEYLVTVLNAPITTERVRPLQSRGEHNPRDFHKHVWKLPIPEYDESNSLHRELVEVGGECAVFVAGLELPKSVRFESVRRFIRDELEAAGYSLRLNDLVGNLLGR
ncbi:N-6 DNA methylase [Gymnodinialimonas hymeniacidonis]|uniref:N-6 DNA methylase n=1 Tax=Gymnodinialimonas hymeniacidonis TaxID=3126508 RepID=UPI0034C62C29